VKPSEKFQAEIFYGGGFPRNKRIIYEKYKNKDCIAFYFVSFDRMQAYMIIKTKRAGFVAFTRNTGRNYDGSRDYHIYATQIKDVIKSTNGKLAASRYEDPVLGKQLYEWRVLHSI